MLAVRFGHFIQEHFRPADLDWRAIDGTMLDRGVSAFVNFQGPMQSFIRFSTGPASWTWNGQRFDGNGMDVFSQIRPRGGLNIRMRVH